MFKWKNSHLTEQASTNSQSSHVSPRIRWLHVACTWFRSGSFMIFYVKYQRTWNLVVCFLWILGQYLNCQWVHIFHNLSHKYWVKSHRWKSSHKQKMYLYIVNLVVDTSEREAKQTCQINHPGTLICMLDIIYHVILHPVTRLKGQ